MEKNSLVNEEGLTPLFLAPPKTFLFNPLITIIRAMRSTTTRLYNWAIHKANHSKAPLWLGLLFFLEIVLIIPLDAVFMFFCLQNRRNIFLYTMIATIASTISGLVGYLFGHFLWDLIGGWVVPNLISTGTFTKLTGYLVKYESWTIFFGGLIPFPLKALSLVAGVFNLGILPFVLFLVTARLTRFILIGATMAIYGEKVKLFVDRHFHKLFLVLGAKIAAAFLFFWVLAR